MILDDFAPLDLDPVAMQEEVCPLCSETESKSMDVRVTCHDLLLHRRTEFMSHHKPAITECIYYLY